MNIKKNIFYLGIISIFLGLSLLPYSSITGNVVLNQYFSDVTGLIGILFFIGGILLVAGAERFDRSRVKNVTKEYNEGYYNPLEAAVVIDRKLRETDNKITGVRYKGDNKSQIKTKHEIIPVNLKDKESAKDLSLAVAVVAEKNEDTKKNCEIKIDNDPLINDKDEVREEEEKFVHKYKEDLERFKIQ